MSSLNLAVIGNCTFGALLDERARIVWACLPRFDSDPIFASLIAGDDGDSKGLYEVELLDFSRAEQHYRDNSAVVVTRLYDSADGVVEITDFAPRFKHFDRIHRPPSIVRHIRPLSGSPRIRLRIRPTYDYGKGIPGITRGSNHLRYIMPHLTLRLTTDAPVTYVAEEVPFILERPVTLILGPDESLTAAVDETSREFFKKTDEYWREWCRYLALPFEWQEAVIRASITLKLCSYEETGAIIAAMTTSIPEAPHSGRNWDYRYCWLRDAYFVVHALNRLGATRTMEGYLSYISNIVASNVGANAADGHLQPVFGISQEVHLDETICDSLSGYRNMGPVRVGNSAYNQIQNDGYGSVILASTQSFFDRRLDHPGDVSLFEKLEKLGQQAIKLWDQPDAGLWELRTRQQVHTYSSVMCWAACDRLSKIAGQLDMPERQKHWASAAKHIRAGVLERAWNSGLNSLVSTFDGSDLDASLLCLHEIGFLPADDPRFLGTLDQVEKQLKHGRFILRYAAPDDFGSPEVTFNVCTFWYIDALAAVGRTQEARDLFEAMLAARNPMGLLSEDLSPNNGELWGNFPQTYSMVGLISSAMRLSKSWEEAY
ncbi:glycoside hydrolase family 15 protein [Pelagibius litoralis]|uniref:Glycoside hydrolase family 15 protein n=1 Tax=Pelagibius litoralis TaxID=374515 RepID=A0A967EZD9_9PROT|nr:glycoside hydrolase family 15 protein [Pelagibius litoralis]NIA70237.1 glycoside hydrolase family 15 protein [Pelagibius litoralis]